MSYDELCRGCKWETAPMEQSNCWGCTNQRFYQPITEKSKSDSAHARHEHIPTHTVRERLNEVLLILADVLKELITGGHNDK